MNEVPINNPNQILEICKKLSIARDDFAKRTENVLNKTKEFTENIEWAIGEISLNEAIEGTINFFKDEMRKK